jgi:RNA polymerase sigma factor (sigma-70 family)
MTDEPEDGPDLPSDEQLLHAARTGDGEAFAALWTRHSPAALRAASQFRHGGEPDDLVAEAYTRILAAVRQGKGPSGAFRPYLLVTIRNLATRVARSTREEATDDLESFETAEFPADPAVAALDRSLTVHAFRSLPERWQTVLWYTAVEGMSPREAASLLGLSANSTAALAHRAREGLREAWIQAHVNDESSSPECRWMLGNMGRHTRRELPVRHRERADEHLSWCQKCMIVSEEIDDVSSRLAIIMIPLLLGGAAGTGYLAALHGVGSATAAQAASSPAGTVTATTRGTTTTGGAVAGGTTARVVAASIAAVVVIATGTWGAIALTSHSETTPPARVDAAAPPAPTDTASPPAGDHLPEATTPPAADPPIGTEPPARTPPIIRMPTLPEPPPVKPPVAPPVEPPIEPPADPPADTVALAPVITTAPTADTVTRPTLAGSAEPGSTITVTDQHGTAVATAIADDAGNWSTGVLGTLSPLTTALSATQRDVAGNVSPPTTIGPFLFRPAILAPDSPATIPSGTDFTFDLAGWSEAEVVIDLDGMDFAALPRQFVFDANGLQSRRVQNLVAGTYDIGVRYLGADPSTRVVVTVTVLP